MDTNSENRAIIKRFIQEHPSIWTDQKIAEVAAFNQDGKMQFKDPCCCFLGVHSSANLHTGYVTDAIEDRHIRTDGYCDREHYTLAKFGSKRQWLTNVAIAEMERAEVAYSRLGTFDGMSSITRQEARNAEFAEILSEIMVEREAEIQCQAERHADREAFELQGV